MIAIDKSHQSNAYPMALDLPLKKSRSLGQVELAPQPNSIRRDQTVTLDNNGPETNIETGLSSREAQYRLSIYGPNDVTKSDKNKTAKRVTVNWGKLSILFGVLGTLKNLTSEGILAKYLQQFHNPLILLLLSSAGVSLVLGQIENCISITLAIILVTTVAFIQEFRTEKSLEELNRLAPPKCHVFRDGAIKELLASDLVPGDLVEIHSGDRIPADLRIFYAIDLEVDESMLTGEAKQCRKRPTDQNNLDQEDLVFMGTLAKQGHGRGIVIATGQETRFGKMYILMKDTEEKRSPLQCHLDLLGQQLSLYSFMVIALISVIGILQSQPWLQIFTVAVSLAVAAIPEGLPIVATITLALGILRLSRRNVIIRKLPAVEALGSIDTLCFDKTGTLTLNKLTLQKVYSVTAEQHLPKDQLSELVKNENVQILVKALRLCSNARKGLDGEWHGNAVDVAMQKYLDSAENSVEFNLVRVDEAPFSSDRKYMAVKCLDEDLTFYFVKGAPEIVIPMTKVPTKGIDSVIASMHKEGLRVLAVAGGKDNENLAILGIIGFCDPPRPGMANTLAGLKSCGIRTIMVTGDSKATAISLASQIGWEVDDESISSGDATAQDGFNLEKVEIIYRATPEQKLRIVDALQKRDHIVAMTGDGVNDAPALKMANIGIAMGKSGTDVARAAAQVILTDDNLSSLIDGVKEGKAIFSNIRHFLRFQLSTSLAALSLIAISMITGNARSGPPMNAMQILLVNIIMDGPPAQSLGVEPVDPIALTCPPRPKSKSILSRGLIIRTIITALHIMIGTFFILRWEDENFGSSDSTRTFAVFVFFSIFNAYTCRSSYRSIFSLRLTSNKFLALSSVMSIIILMTIVYVPFMNGIFLTRPIGLWDWIIIIGVSGSLLISDELIKAFAARPALSKRGNDLEMTPLIAIRTL